MYDQCYPDIRQRKLSTFSKLRRVFLGMDNVESVSQSQTKINKIGVKTFVNGIETKFMKSNKYLIFAGMTAFQSSCTILSYF